MTQQEALGEALDRQRLALAAVLADPELTPEQRTVAVAAACCSAAVENCTILATAAPSADEVSTKLGVLDADRFRKLLPPR